ncbi:MAG: hypothetical protein EBQ87_09375 [Planctomycetes bacterium]|nr:hypothetical protein [Planctomycetota bacterium]
MRLIPRFMTIDKTKCQALTPLRAFWLEVQKGFIGGLLWGSIVGAGVGALNANPWLLGFQFALLILAVWILITTSVGVVRGIRRAREVWAATHREAEPTNAPDSR